MDKDIFIGFDGGGTTSRFLLGRENHGPELFTISRNLKYSDLGITASADGFMECIKEILGENIGRLRSMCISLSGASNEMLNKEFAAELQKKISPSLKLHIESDSSFTLETAY